jgi:hypothetical protein
VRAAAGGSAAAARQDAIKPCIRGDAGQGSSSTEEAQVQQPPRKVRLLAAEAGIPDQGMRPRPIAAPRRKRHGVERIAVAPRRSRLLACLVTRRCSVQRQQARL